VCDVKSANPLEEVVRVTEAARLVGVDSATIMRAVEDGKLDARPSKAGGKQTYLITVSSLRAAYPLKFNEELYRELIQEHKE
jgi:hypothetical protein